MVSAFVLAAALAAAQRSPVVVAHDAWEQCAVEAAVAAIPTIADDRAVAAHAREACAAQGLAFVELWIEQRFVRFPAGVDTREQRIANALERHWRGHETLILSILPEARRTGARRVRMRHRHRYR